MALIPWNFENQLVAASDMAAVLQSLVSDGPLHGCAQTFAGGTFTLAPGRLILAGFVVRLSASESVAVSGTSGSKKIVAKLDRNAACTASEFSQLTFRAEAADYALVQGDLAAGTDAVYEAEVATVTLGDTGITAIASAWGSARRVIYCGTTEPASTLGADGDIYIQYTE